MAALLPLHRSIRLAEEPACRVSAIGAPTTTILAHLQEWRQKTACLCHASHVALRWNVSDECRGVRLPASDLLHVSGVLHNLVAGSIHGGCTRNLRVGFDCRRNRLMLAVEDDGGEVGQPRSVPHPGVGNVEYLAAQTTGRLRHEDRGRYRASILWLPLG